MLYTPKLYIWGHWSTHILNMEQKKFDREISRSIYRSLKRKKSGYIWERVIGITYDELKSALESKFTEEMNWENYGSYWVIDKIIPTRFFRYEDRANNEFQKAWSLKNFRPLTRVEHNRRKQKVDMELVESYSLYDILPIGNLLDK